MYGYIVASFKHIEDLDKVADIQSAILNYLKFKSKSLIKIVIQEHGENGDNVHWNILIEHKTPAHLLDIFKNYYGDYYTPGITVKTKKINSQVDLSHVLIGYLHKEDNYKIIHKEIDEDLYKHLEMLHEVHTIKTTTKDQVIKRFTRITDTEFLNLLYDSFFSTYEECLKNDLDFFITEDEFKTAVQSIGKSYNIVAHLNKLRSFYTQLKMTYGISRDSDISLFF